jgi:hypothetical protein
VELKMPKFESPISNKQFQNPPTREFNVPDESGFTPPPAPPHRHAQPPQQYEPIAFDPQAMREFQAVNQQPQGRGGPVREMTDIEKQIFDSKKAKREGKERLSDGARRRVEVLIGMTRLTKDVEVGGQLYKLQTLKSRELRDALVATTEFDGTIQMVFETRRQLLGRSLVVVAGVEIEQFLNSMELQDKLDFIEEMPHELLTRLYDEYLSLANEAQSRFTLKTVADVKEVVEDLKK